MSYLRTAISSISARGFWSTSLRAWVFMVDRIFDIVNGTETFATFDAHISKREDELQRRATFYEPTRVLPLRAILKRLKKGKYLNSNSVLVDFGCGKGRVLLIASEFDVKAARGIEFAAGLCDIATANCNIFKRRWNHGTKLDVINADAMAYAINSDEEIFFLFNPFDRIILTRVMSNIITSIKDHERSVLIVYNNPKYRDVIEESGCFRKIIDDTVWTYHFVVYANC